MFYFNHFLVPSTGRVSSVGTVTGLRHEWKGVQVSVGVGYFVISKHAETISGTRHSFLHKRYRVPSSGIKMPECEIEHLPYLALTLRISGAILLLHHTHLHGTDGKTFVFTCVFPLRRLFISDVNQTGNVV
jgi:hypothetical protein